MRAGTGPAAGACATGLVLLACAGAASGGPSASPRPAIAFADRLHGFAAGAGGILRTVDGGRTWRRVSAVRTAALDAVGPRQGFALAGGAVLRTDDGRRWRRTSTPGLVAVDFWTPRRGLGLDRVGGLLASADGGRRWRLLPSPSGLQALCATRAGAWVAGREVVWRRGAGGWRVALPARLDRGGEGPLPELGCRGRSVWALFHRGVAAGSEGYDVFRSLDGGRTWRAVLAGLDPLRPRLPRLAPRPGPLAVLGGGAAVLVGFCPVCGRGPVTVVSTADGGRSWRRSTPLQGYAPAAVSFVDRRRGWLLTASPAGSAAAGLIWATADGGRTWRLLLRSPVLTVAPP